MQPNLMHARTRILKGNTSTNNLPVNYFVLFHSNFSRKVQNQFQICIHLGTSFSTRGIVFSSRGRHISEVDQFFTYDRNIFSEGHDLTDKMLMMISRIRVHGKLLETSKF